MAIWNGTLFYKSGTLWKYSSNSINYNPCTSDWIEDFINLRGSKIVQSSYLATCTMGANCICNRGGTYTPSDTYIGGTCTIINTQYKAFSSF